MTKYLKLNSVIHKWQIEAKIIGLLPLIFAFAFINKLILLPVIIVITTCLYILSKLPFSLLLKKLHYPGLFIATLIIFLPFISGNTVILNIGWLSIKKEGCLSVLLIVTRLICIIAVSLVLFATAPFLNSIKALGKLGLSQVIIDMMLLSYRYLEELAEISKKMQNSLQLRGFKSRRFNIATLKSLAQLIGTLLIRSYEKSHRVYQAMILRGYGNQNFNQNRKNQFKIIKKEDKISWIASFITIFIAISLIIAEIYI